MRKQNCLSFEEDQSPPTFSLKWPKNRSPLIANNSVETDNLKQISKRGFPKITSRKIICDIAWQMCVCGGAPLSRNVTNYQTFASVTRRCPYGLNPGYSTYAIMFYKSIPKRTKNAIENMISFSDSDFWFTIKFYIIYLPLF